MSALLECRFPSSARPPHAPAFNFTRSTSLELRQRLQFSASSHKASHLVKARFPLLHPHSGIRGTCWTPQTTQRKIQNSSRRSFFSRDSDTSIKSSLLFSPPLPTCAQESGIPSQDAKRLQNQPPNNKASHPGPSTLHRKLSEIRASTRSCSLSIFGIIFAQRLAGPLRLAGEPRCGSWHGKTGGAALCWRLLRARKTRLVKVATTNPAHCPSPCLHPAPWWQSQA